MEVRVENAEMDHPYEEAASYLLSRISNLPEVGIICGSGLSGLSNHIENPQTIVYEDIPGFPSATVAGHTGELVFGTMGGLNVVCMRGRFHFYEGNHMTTVAMPVRVMRLIGVRLLVVTNAAGGLNPDYQVGDIAIIQDHFGGPIISGNSPLVGPNNDALGPRFPATSDTYCEDLQEMVLKCAKSLKLESYMRRDATYCFVSGPSYESRAECRFLRSIGGDSVGMSTVPEIIAAKHVGMKIVCLSMITNKVIIEKRRDSIHASHEEVLASVKAAGARVETLVKAFVDSEVIGSYIKKLPPNKPYTPQGASKRYGKTNGAAKGVFADVHMPTVLMAGALTITILMIRDGFFSKK